MAILMCSKCRRIKPAEDKPWSAQPSTRIKPTAPNVQVVEECDVCEGNVQLDPEEVLETVGADPADEIDGEEEQTKLAKAEADDEDDGEEIDLDDPAFNSAAHEHHQALVAAKRLMGQSLMAFCTHLREMKVHKYYLAHAESWYEYLAQPDVGIDNTRARRLIRLVTVKEALEKGDNQELDISDISEGRLTRGVLPCIKFDEKKGVVKNEEEVKELLDKARSLGHNDWEAEVAKHKPTAGGKKQVEARISDGPIKNPEGTIIGHIISVKANEENHYLHIRINNGDIPDDTLIIHIE